MIGLRRRLESDEGSIILAMLALVVVTTAALVGLTALLQAHKSARHDVAFEQSLAGAESGLDAVIAEIRANPSAASVTPVTGTDATTGATYTASATGGSGHWVVTAAGTAIHGDTSVTRHVQQQVTVGDLLSYGLVGLDELTLGGSGNDSGVDVYNSASSSAVCDTAGSSQSMGYTNARMCNPASPSLGPVATGGPLTMATGDINNVSEADVYNTPYNGYPDSSATGACVGDAGTCASAKVVTSHDQLDYPLSSMCANGVGAGASAFDGSFALAANAVYNFTNVTLNATAIANLANLSGSRLVICFSGTLTVPPLVPLNATTASLVPLRLNPRPPSTLVLISTAPAGGGTPVVDFGLGLNSETSLSAVVYAPNARCQATGHLDLYGILVCKRAQLNGGASVHYDNQLGSLPFDQPFRVSAWQEIH